MELETKVSRFKSKKFWFKVVVLIIGISIIYGMGNSSAKVELGKQKVKYDEAVKIVNQKNQEIEDVQGKLDDINQQYSDKKSEFDTAMKVVENKKSVEDEIAKLDDIFEGKKNDVSKLNSDIKSKKDQLASITGQIKEKKSAPIILPAGKFTVGKDLPEGRYKAVSNGGNGNFFINDGADANIILGNGDLAQSSYVFDVINGDEIETTLSVKFIPVK